jgi:hypothetical protein
LEEEGSQAGAVNRVGPDLRSLADFGGLLLPAGGRLAPCAAGEYLLYYYYAGLDDQVYYARPGAARRHAGGPLLDWG